MSAPQQGDYRLLGRSGVFAHRLEAVAKLLQRGVGTIGVMTDGPSYRVTNFPGDSTRVLFVRGFHVNFNARLVIFREAVEEVVGAPAEEVRYVVLERVEDDWRVCGVVAGPLGDSDSNARAGIDQALKSADPSTTASAFVRIPTDYLGAASQAALQRVTLYHLLDQTAIVATGFKQRDCKRIGAHLQLHREELSGGDNAALGTVTIGRTRVDAYYVAHEVTADTGDRQRTLRATVMLYVTDGDSDETVRYVTVLRWDVESNNWRLPHENGALVQRGDLTPVLQLGANQSVPPLQSIVADLRRG